MITVTSNNKFFKIKTYKNSFFLLKKIIEIFNADIVIREDISVEQFIDVVLGNRRYINCIYVSKKERDMDREWTI
jgi:ribosome-interacting GTPase 1